MGDVGWIGYAVGGRGDRERGGRGEGGQADR